MTTTNGTATNHKESAGMNKADMLKRGITPNRAEYLFDCQTLCDNELAYRATHETLTRYHIDEFYYLYDIPHKDIADLYVDVESNLHPGEPHLFRGLYFVGVKLPEPLTDEERDYFNDHSGYTVEGFNSDEVLIGIEDNLVIRAKLYTKE